MVAKKTIKIKESDLHKIISKVIAEVSYNYHIGNIEDVSNIKPYYSDNKKKMIGRDTGHFGSGIYFSTYGGKYDSLNSDDNDTPQFIQIKDKVYRVDFDLYKNLYRVEDNRQGDMLFNTLKNLNALYNKVVYNDFDCSKNYLIIQRNSDALDLKCPSYKELLKMAKEHAKNNNDLRSFSTVFMEYNGFNGINVSNVPKYDNTLHGSVIYDMSKIEPNSIRQVNIKRKNIPFTNSEVATDNELEDPEYLSLIDYPNLSFYKISETNLANNPNKLLRLFKNYSFIPKDIAYINHYLSEDVSKKYFKILYNNLLKDKIKNPEEITNNKVIEYIFNNELFYFVNIPPFKDRTVYESILLSLINSAFFDDNPKPIIDKILSYLKRNLTSFEEETLNKWLNEKGE